MTPEEIRELVSRLDTTSQQREQEAWSRLRDLGAAVVPYLAEAYRAYALRPDAVAHLRPLLRHGDQRTAEDAKAAIDAIAHRNHHFFVDRTHSGRSFWQVGDDGAGA